jgi:hypothetical protein
MDPAANATATDTVPFGPSTADAIGRPAPARFGKAMVRACMDASLDTFYAARTAKTHPRYSTSMTAPRIPKGGA